MKELYYDALDPDLPPPDPAAEAAAARRLAQHRADEAAARARLEAAWAAAWPAEWREWLRVRPLVIAPYDFVKGAFDFEDFLREVGRSPSHRHAVERVRERESYGPGNLRWAERASTPPRSPYLDAAAAAAYLGVAVQTLRNNRKRYRPVNATRPLLYDPAELDAALRGVSRRGVKPRARV